MSGYAHSGMSREDYEAREQLRSVAALIEERWPSEYQILQTELEMLVERIEKSPRVSQSEPEPEGPHCVKCRHPKRDHDGRPDHLTNHSPLVAGDPWCHACDAECHYEDPGEYTGIKRSCFFRDRATHRVRRWRRSPMSDQFFEGAEYEDLLAAAMYGHSLSEAQKLIDDFAHLLAEKIRQDALLIENKDDCCRKYGLALARTIDPEAG